MCVCRVFYSSVVGPFVQNTVSFLALGGGVSERGSGRAERPPTESVARLFVHQGQSCFYLFFFYEPVWGFDEQVRP